MNKNGIEYWLVGTIILLVVFVILLGAMPRIIDILKRGGEHQVCSISSVLESSGKVGGVRTFTSDCPRDEEEVTMSVLNKNLDDVEKEVKKYDGTKDAYTERDPKIWNLNKFIAKEMKQCWEKLGAGELNLFPEWWKLIGYNQSNEKELFGLQDFLKVWNLKFKEPPRFCVICSRIRFDPDVRKDVYEQHPGGSIDSLNKWMRNNAVPNSGGISYLEYIEDDVHKGLFGLSSYQYQLSSQNLPDKPLAVLYVQQNVWKGQQWAEGVLEFAGLKSDVSTPIHSLELVPLDETSEICTVLEG